MSKRNSCKYCGTCLSRCVYLRLDPDEAAAEMRRLDAGSPTPHIDRACVSCFACNAFCPNSADPYGRILRGFERAYNERGLPTAARYLLPTSTKSFRTDVLRALPADERRMVADWANAEPAGEVLYPGCNLITCAYLARSAALDGLTISGSLELCCGEMYFRMGLLEQAREMAERLTEYYGNKRIERMIFVCPACYNMFANELPQRFGARFDFEKIYLTDYLLERIKSGELRVQKPLEMSVTIHDSCHARVLGPQFMERVRELLAALGAQVREAGHSREDGYCCGIAAAAPRQSVLDLLRVAATAHAEYRGSGAQGALAYCSGCFLTLGMLGPLLRGLPLLHLLELTSTALGRPIQNRLGPRGRTMLRNVALNALPKLLSSERFKL